MSKNKRECFRMTILFNFNTELTGLNKKAVELAVQITNNSMGLGI